MTSPWNTVIPLLLIDMTETFTFSHLNFYENEQQKRQRPRASNNKRISTPSTSTTPPTNQPTNQPTNPTVRTSLMSLFVNPKIIAHSSFDPEKYIQTPRGLINKAIFSMAKTNPASFVSPLYISDFPERVVRDAAIVVSESDSVLKFVLEHIRQIPCGVPVRWGVLFNLKFRRIFQCLTTEKWDGLCKALERNGFAKIEKSNVYLKDPESETTEYSDLFFDLSDRRSEGGNGNDNSESATSYSRNTSTISTTSNTNNLQINTHINDTLARIDPLQTPLRNRQGDLLFYSSNSNSNSNGPERITIIPVDSPAVIPVPRAHNHSIYAIKYCSSIDPDLSPRFRTRNFTDSLQFAISEIFDAAQHPIDKVYAQLDVLPIDIPLRWGYIYNKHLRVRRQTPQTAIIKLEQWKKVKNALKLHGYLEDKSVPNCVVLKNKQSRQ